mmetsp:Transcript_18203/g.13242  ORF Transcript_18203/g.13242 Transcript_18203/m.13242 type:complete len:112 (-) Transcript_18203:114-449(-)
MGSHDGEEVTQEGMTSTIKYSLSKLLFEFIGTACLTVIFICGQGLVDANSSVTGGSFGSQQVALLLGLWILTIFGYRVSGSHYNPAVTLAFMFRKDVGRFPRMLGLAYILF